MLLASYIGIMQAGPNPENPGPSHLREFNMEEDTSMHNPSSAKVGYSSFAGRAPKHTVLTRLQQKKKAAIA